MNIVNFRESPMRANPHGVDVRNLYDHENAQVNVVTLEPGQTLKPHITHTEVFFYVLEGCPSIRVGEVTEPVEKDSLVESPNGIIHCISNNGETLARVLVVKAPRPTEAARLL